MDNILCRVLVAYRIKISIIYFESRKIIVDCFEKLKKYLIPFLSKY